MDSIEGKPGSEASKATSGDSIYRRLRDRIVAHDILPGQRLDVRRLAEDFKISPIPVRDAINRLTGEALVHHVPSRGYFARSFSAPDLIEAYDMIFALLRHAVQLSTRPFEFTGLPVRPNSLDLADDLPQAHKEELAKQYMIFKEALFERIAGLSGSHTAVSVARYFLNRTNYARTRDLLDPSYMSVLDPQIDALFSALVTRDRNAVLIALEKLMGDKMYRLPRLASEIEEQILIAEAQNHARNSLDI
ncbi:hypothetical protein BJF93_09040 [Xaviernesmea oryzae]|uniref:HTH gntR-type domain-containing protein n=1 Tax=Xaviernesmea oryzae TaxID=464029 RepID=A0A1Q9B3Q7_9HYPH|nr:GntR family transcriptional regulator [Xaviernesmea oryzae]OLP62682.1 hypothetical protein BJF93_09040 [Xaviernesmea oryzae]SEM36379.1 DNA-binding transcriptional regulator, GntR family [Xaviernesmea oryzae]